MYNVNIKGGKLYEKRVTYSYSMYARAGRARIPLCNIPCMCSETQCVPGTQSHAFTLSTNPRVCIASTNNDCKGLPFLDTSSSHHDNA